MAECDKAPKHYNRYFRRRQHKAARLFKRVERATALRLEIAELEDEKNALLSEYAQMCSDLKPFEDLWGEYLDERFCSDEEIDWQDPEFVDWRNYYSSDSLWS